MADSDSNIIKPVETMQNLPGVTPAKRREERKRRQERGYTSEEEYNRQQEAETGNKDKNSAKKEKNGQSGDTIDYCA
jgi:hypothetical protein